MYIKKTITIVTMAAAMATFAAPIVTDVTAKQRYPWNGKVDITCKVSGITSATKPFKFAVSAVNSGVVRNISRFWVGKDGKYPDEKNPIDHAVHANGTYHLVWDSQADFYKQICSNMVIRVNIVEIDKVKLWADGPYWATRNIGAENPEDCGYYFWWGDTVGYKWEIKQWVPSDGSPFGSMFTPAYNASNFPTCDKSAATLKSEGWITADEVLAPEHDAAHVRWGGSWRMPTKQELYDLNNNCDWTWTTMNGVNGYVVRGRGGYTSNSIFLPAAGHGIDIFLFDSGSCGWYLSSVPGSGGSDAWDLFFESSKHITASVGPRYCGWSIRPVTD